MARCNLVGTLVVRAAGLCAAAGGIASGQVYERQIERPSGQQILDVIEVVGGGGGTLNVGEERDDFTFDTSFSISRHGPDGTTLWSVRAGGLAADSATSAVEASDGGFVVAGLSESGPAEAGIGVVKLSASGQVLWSRLYAGDSADPDPTGAARGVVIKRVGIANIEYVIVGRRTVVAPTFEKVGGHIIGLDVDGNVVFQRTYYLPPAASPDVLVFSDLTLETRIVQRARLHISGTFQRDFTGPGIAGIDNDLLYARIDLLSGAVEVFRTYGETPDPFAFQPPWETGEGIELIPPSGPDGLSVAFAGRTDRGFSNESTAVLRLDSAGVPIWNLISDRFSVAPAAVRVDPDRNVVLAGAWSFGDGGRNAVLASYDVAGVPRFRNEYTGSGFSVSGFEGLAVISGAGGYEYAAGGGRFVPFAGFEGDGYFVKTSPSGSTGCELAETPAGDAPVLQIADLTPLIEEPTLSVTWPLTWALDVPAAVLVCTPRCVADVDDGSGSGIPDGGVGIEDLVYYLALYDAGDPGADVDDGSGTGTPDGGVGIEDLLYYLARYDAGC